VLTRTTLFLALVAAPAFATDQYPAVLQNRFSLPVPPGCQVCHFNGITARGTVTTPVGTSLRDRGLVANDSASLNTALDALANEMVDSDGDGVSDVEEFMNGTDPNEAAMGTGGGAGGGTGAGGGLVDAGPLRYGCGATVVPQLLLLAGLVPLLRRRAKGSRS
jgi:hypothetical protein